LFRGTKKFKGHAALTSLLVNSPETYFAPSLSGTRRRPLCPERLSNTVKIGWAVFGIGAANWPIRFPLARYVETGQFLGVNSSVSVIRESPRVFAKNGFFQVQSMRVLSRGRLSFISGARYQPQESREKRGETKTPRGRLSAFRVNSTAGLFR
jgi:hypothetical protein